MEQARLGGHSQYNYIRAVQGYSLLCPTHILRYLQVAGLRSLLLGSSDEDV